MLQNKPYKRSQWIIENKTILDVMKEMHSLRHHMGWHLATNNNKDSKEVLASTKKYDFSFKC